VPVSRALLAFAALWPAVTLILQHQYDVDPWKLMSFGMYATAPRRPDALEVELSVRRGDQWCPASADLSRFKLWRQTLGRLVSVEPLFDELFRQPDVQSARIVIRSPRIQAWVVSTYEKSEGGVTREYASVVAR
jgi:hypothetical protein